MRSFLFLAVLPAVIWAAAPALKLDTPVISQMEGGDPDPAGFEHLGGETLFFSCRIAGFTKSSENKVHLTYSIQAFDAKSVPITEPVKGQVLEEVLPQDKDWLPKIAAEVLLPPLALPGEYKILVKAQDVQSDAVVETPIGFHVRGRAVAPSETLVVRNFGFYRSESDSQPMARAAYRNGVALVVKFDLTGYKYGAGNKIDVSYVASILGADNRVLWKQSEPDVEQSRVAAEAFYPQPYIPEYMQLALDKVAAGTYTVLIQVKDAVGNQTAEAHHTFTVE